MNLAHSVTGLIDEWLLKNLGSFDPFDFGDNNTRFFRRKAFSELALFLLLRHKLNVPVDDYLLSFVLERAGTARYLNLAVRYPRRLLLYSSPLLLLLRCDKDQSHKAREAIEKASRSRALWAAERPAHRWFDLFFALDEANVAPDTKDKWQLIEFSSINNLPCPIESALEDFYALTHAAFYLTQFGMHAVPTHLVGFDKQELRETHELSICRYMAERNFDIVLELIVSEYFLLGRLFPVATWAAHETFQELMKLGRLASPQSEHAEKFADSYPDESEWGRCYHTMLVAGLSCATINSNAFSGNRIDKRSALIVGETLRRAAHYDLLSVIKVLNAGLFDIDLNTKDMFRPRLTEFISRHTTQCHGCGYWADEPYAFSADEAESTKEFERKIESRVQEEFKIYQDGLS